MPNDVEIYDIVIIGGGPAGLSAAIYAARAKLKTILIDKSPLAGALGMATKIANYPGMAQPLAGKELLTLFRQQAQQFGAEIVQAQVIDTNLTANPKEVYTGERTYYTKTVIIATGARGRQPAIKGEAEFIGKGVAYCSACDAAFFADSSVAVAGENEEMLEELAPITKYAAKAYLITRNNLLINQHQQSIRQNPRVEVKLGYRLEEIIGQEMVSGVIISDSKGNKETLEVAGVFVYLQGNQPIVNFLKGQVAATPEGCIRINREDMSTSIEGVYAIGDVTCKKVRQAVVSAAEGCIAALSVERYLNKRAAVVPQWH